MIDALSMADALKLLTPEDFLSELRRRGAKRIRRVVFRRNRSTMWSLTQRGTVLNVHAGYGEATPGLLDAFAVLATEGGVRSGRARRAASEIGAWPPVLEAIREAREAHDTRHGSEGRAPTYCCATPEQRHYVHRLYDYFNRTRFGSALPVDVPVRLSNRMRTALGHMLPGERPDGTRYVVEIALNVDLMLEGNGPERVDTLLHEMAHVADYLASGHRGHGRSWREWATRVGCQPTTLYHRPVVFRGRHERTVTRVPPLPPTLSRGPRHRDAPTVARSTPRVAPAPAGEVAGEDLLEIAASGDPGG